MSKKSMIWMGPAFVGVVAGVAVAVIIVIFLALPADEETHPNDLEEPGITETDDVPSDTEHPETESGEETDDETDHSEETEEQSSAGDNMAAADALPFQPGG